PELPPARVDEDEELVIEVLEDVRPAHLDRLPDDLLLVLVEGDEDPLLPVMEPAPDELSRERRLPRAGAADDDRRGPLVEPAVDNRVQAEDAGLNLLQRRSIWRTLLKGIPVGIEGQNQARTWVLPH